MIKLFSVMNWILFWQYQDEEHRPYCEFMYEVIKSGKPYRRSKGMQDSEQCLAAQVIHESRHNEHFACLERFLKVVLTGYYAKRVAYIHRTFDFHKSLEGEVKATIIEFIDGSYIIAYPVTLGASEIICLIYRRDKQDAQLNEVVHINSW